MSTLLLKIDEGLKSIIRAFDGLLIQAIECLSQFVEVGGQRAFDRTGGVGCKTGKILQRIADGSFILVSNKNLEPFQFIGN